MIDFSWHIGNFSRKRRRRRSRSRRRRRRRKKKRMPSSHGGWNIRRIVKGEGKEYNRPEGGGRTSLTMATSTLTTKPLPGEGWGMANGAYFSRRLGWGTKMAK
jgi:hypothetical protein